MSGFELTRSITVDADPGHVRALVEDFHQWPRWSPWEELDPDLRRTYSGPESGAGARYAWQGNRKAGAGSMEITSVTPHEVRAHLRFLKPFRTENDLVFRFQPGGRGTEVTWQMLGERSAAMAAMARVMKLDAMIGRDFEKGLARLKAAAES